MPLDIPQSNPKASYMAYKQEIDAAINQVLESGLYVLGNQVIKFEKDFASYVGVSYAVGVGSGTDAIHLALKVCDIGPGDIVITVSHTAVATVAAIELAGAIPVLIDIDPMSYTLDPACLENAIKKIRTGLISGLRGQLKAVIPVHLYGYPADMPAIMDIAKRNDLFVIEDCAQSLGASINGRNSGTWGNLSTFSFYPTKNLGAIGDGGALVTNDLVLANKARSIRQYGWNKRYVSDTPGMNTRLDEIQAAILRVKLSHLDKDNEKRGEIASIYSTLLSKSQLILPQVRRGIGHAFHQYVVRISQRDNLQSYLKSENVSTSVLYPIPIHLQPAYKARMIDKAMSLKYTQITCKEILSLPIYPQMSYEQVHRVCSLISLWEKQNKDII